MAQRRFQPSMFNTFFTQFYSISHKDITVEKKVLGFIYKVLAICKTDLFCARFYFCDFVMQPVCLFVCFLLLLLLLFFLHMRGVWTRLLDETNTMLCFTRSIAATVHHLPSWPPLSGLWCPWAWWGRVRFLLRLLLYFALFTVIFSCRIERIIASAVWL